VVVDDVNIAEILERIGYVQDLAMVRKDERLLRDVDGRMEDSFCFRVPMRKEPHIMAPLASPFARWATTSSVPPYPTGGHEKKGGAIKAIRIFPPSYPRGISSESTRFWIVLAYCYGSRRSL
jgi:hypothetical protein